MNRRWRKGRWQGRIIGFEAGACRLSCGHSAPMLSAQYHSDSRIQWRACPTCCARYEATRDHYRRRVRAIRGSCVAG